MSYPICGYLKSNGVPCGSPALRGKKLCFFHHRDAQRRRYVDRLLRLNDPLRPGAPLPRTLPDLQVRLSVLLNALAGDRIAFRPAGKLLLALQQASVPLRSDQNQPCNSLRHNILRITPTP